MSTATDATDPAHDFRLADFKLFLPLGPDCRALVAATRERAFIPHLAAELGGIDILDESGQLAGTAGVRCLEAAEGPYDLVFSDDFSAMGALRPGGVLCRFLGTDELPPGNDLIAIGRWRACPAWPAFRVLIPEHDAGWRAAVRDFHLFPRRSMTALGARLYPPLASLGLARRGIALYRRTGGPVAPLLLESLWQALAGAGHRASAAPVDQWLLVSGRLGPGNPILAFSLQRRSHPRHLIKVAREAKGAHLDQEAVQLRAIAETLGPRVAAPVIQPDAAARDGGRWVLAYSYQPTRRFFGIGWRLRARAGYCKALTGWLIEVARTTRRMVAADSFHARHVAPLQRLLERGILPSTVQREAEAGLTPLLQQASSLPEVLEHGDLGIYNTRLTRADGSGFRVLDWGSSTFNGIPLGDLCYLLASAHAPRALAARCLHHYCTGLELTPAVAPGLWFSYLARRWEELDGIRPPLPDDPGSGGGILLPVQARVADYLSTLKHLP